MEVTYRIVEVTYRIVRLLTGNGQPSSLQLPKEMAPIISVEKITLPSILLWTWIQHPLPKPGELFASIANGQKFSKLDLSEAYQWVLLEGESKKYTTVNTHQGLYQYNHLLFGIAFAHALF